MRMVHNIISVDVYDISNICLLFFCIFISLIIPILLFETKISGTETALGRQMA